MKKYYCTYFDRNYLAKGLALIESLDIHESCPYQLIVICLDTLTLNFFNFVNYKNVKAISLNEVEKNDTELKRAKSNRSLIEYYWTLTPTILLRLFEWYPWIKIITYLDADLFFYASPDPILHELGNNSVMLHEHRFSPEQQYLERNGKYNKGILCFKNDFNSLKVLNWWRNQCNKWCYHRLEDGKFGDQLYLNQFPIRFKGITVLQNIGAGVAPWNHIQYEFSEDNTGKKLVNKKPLIFYHFHSLEIVTPEIIVPSKYFPTTPFTIDIIKICFEQYAQQLYKNFQKLQSIINNFHSDL
ncbi:MAG: glycosyltransferase [Candidatus Magnetoglobus multicellularis str. Araruama]|uniref:Glycosyltransferase n=1 Tax=Candidatus Magnetoglobus multicellularis str. Araruama TaxID=890399 RepID=A0A1V1NVD5_9BACT|nr:MAG: glycosyltransferase [Candidatus Magnetoglobus multicellularis str. Araruama]